MPIIVASLLGVAVCVVAAAMGTADIRQTVSIVSAGIVLVLSFTTGGPSR
jgi:hypothetical protein